MSQARANVDHVFAPGRWVHADLDEMLPDLRVDIFSDFGLLGGSLDEAKLLAEHAPGFELPVGLVLREWKARELIRSHEDLDDLEREMQERAERRAERDAELVAEMTRGPRSEQLGVVGSNHVEEQTA